VTTFLVGLDASEHAADALAWARSVAAPDERIVVLHAKELPIVTGYEGAAAVDPADTEAVAGEFVAGVVGEYDDTRLDGRLIDGPAGRAIVEASETLEGEVVIVVGHGGSGKASLLLGSTAHHVVHHTDHPVVVVRGETRLPVRHVVVGVDGSGDDAPDARSLVALRWAVRLRGVEQVDVSHADFVPAVAAGPVREPGLESDDAVAEDDAHLRRAISAATDGTGVAPNGATIVPVVAGGTGGFALIEASREVDLVVIGTHGRSGFVELLVGSTTLEVLAHAHCPVAVVR
jgi:nucleotide-binding universal stress UspA family protein